MRQRYHPDYTLRWTPGPPTLERLIAILKLSTFYDIEDGRDYAIINLDTRGDLCPATRLHLARNYRVGQWIYPGFQQLVSVPILSLTREDIEAIQTQTFIVLVRTKARIDHHRQTCAVKAPPVVHGDGCMGRNDCERAWQNAWWGEAGRSGVVIALIHPDSARSGREILNKLDDLQLSWHMDVTCQALTISKLRGTGNLISPLLKEEEYVRTAAEELKKIYGC
jgi:hypothetical protein